MTNSDVGAVMAAKKTEKTSEKIVAASSMAGERRTRGTLVALSAGALSGTCSTLMFQPFDLIKTRMQTQLIPRGAQFYQLAAAAGNGGGTASVSMLGTFTSVVQRENVFGLWKGISPSLTRCVPGIGIYFGSIDFLKSLIGENDRSISPFQALAIGGVARSFTATILLPITVTKTRFESGQYQYKSVPNALRHIWKSEGTKGLFGGLWATLARDAPFSALYLAFYTQAKQATMNVSHINSLTPLQHLSCGIVAGFAASVMTQPADVIKTRMQLQPKAYPSFPTTVANIIRSNGVHGMFTGAVPRAMRRTLMAAFTWAFYEEITRFIKRGLD